MSLLTRVRTGDAAALDTLIARYRPRLVRWASGRLPAYARDLSETQDLVQETLLSAFAKIGGIEIRGEGALQAYLRQALLNRVRMELRRVRRRPPPDPLSELASADDASPVEAAIGREALDAYERGLATLSPAERELVIAHVEFGYTPEELATMFGKPTPNAARSALRRAVLRLARAMK